MGSALHGLLIAAIRVRALTWTQQSFRTGKVSVLLGWRLLGHLLFAHTLISGVIPKSG